MTAAVRRARTAFWWVGVIVPLGLLLLSTAVVLAWFPELPDPVATHWSGAEPDGFGPRWTILVPVLIGAALIVLFAVLALFAHRVPSSLLSGGGGVVSDAQGAPQWSVTARVLGAASLGLGAMMALLVLVCAHVQLGLEDAADAGDITGWVFAGFGLMVALAIAGWFLQPRVEYASATGAETEPVPLGVTERAAWFATASIARGGAVTLALLWLFLAATTVFVMITDAATGWILVVTTVLMLVAIAGSLAFRVRVSGRGLRVRSILGWPDTRIALENITKVEVVTVNPFAEFGGWGWRWGADGRRGVVLRAGEALQVTQRNGRVFVVTIDAAEDAAAVLDGLRAARKENDR